MSKQFIFVGILALLFLIGIFAQKYFINNSSQNSMTIVNAENSPVNFDNNLTMTVIKICKSVEENDINKLKNSVIEVPDIYTQKSRESMRKYAGMNEKTYKEVTKEQKGKFNVSLYPISSTKEELVFNAIPAIKLIQEQKRKFIRIVDLKQFENEAKVAVEFGNDELAGLNYEILLFKVNDEWKTFRFTYKDRWADTYAEKPQN